MVTSRGEETPEKQPSLLYLWLFPLLVVFANGEALGPFVYLLLSLGIFCVVFFGGMALYIKFVTGVISRWGNVEEVKDDTVV